MNLASESEIWIWNLKSASEIWILNPNIKSESEIWIWIWNLGLESEFEIWIRNLNVISEYWFWIWNLKSESGIWNQTLLFAVAVAHSRSWLCIICMFTCCCYYYLIWARMHLCEIKCTNAIFRLLSITCVRTYFQIEYHEIWRCSKCDSIHSNLYFDNKYAQKCTWTNKWMNEWMNETLGV